jgi:2-dehydro-3-deoxygalactonokinase
LSGLLIGHELAGLAALLESRGGSLAGEAPRLIGSAALCERYRLALTEFGCLRASVVEAAAENGLWRIALQAGLVEREAMAPAS